MNRKTVALVFVAVTLLVAIFQLSYWYAKLPAEVPSHFGANGEPDRWMSKSGFSMVFICVHLGTIGFMVLINFLIRVLPTELINLPNKEYWLAEPRREQTLSQIQSDMLTIGGITCWLMIGIFHLSSRVATGYAETINPYSWFLIGTYMATIIGFCVWLIVRYQVHPEIQKG